MSEIIETLKLINRNLNALANRLEALELEVYRRRVIPEAKAYRYVEIPLDKARADEEFYVEGDNFAVVEVGGSGDVKVRVQDKIADQLDLRKVKSYKHGTKFNRLYITNDASPGNKLVLAVGGQAEISIETIKIVDLDDDVTRVLGRISNLEEALIDAETIPVSVPSIAGGGGTGNFEVSYPTSVGTQKAWIAYIRVVSTSTPASDDFDVELFEKSDRSLTNRIFRSVNNDTVMSYIGTPIYTKNQSGENKVYGTIINNSANASAFDVYMRFKRVIS